MKTLFTNVRTLMVLGPVLLASGLATGSSCASGATSDTFADTGASGTTGTGKTTSSGDSTGSAGTAGQGGGINISAGSASGTGGAGGGCGRENFNVAVQPVDVLLVLDRSASMEDDPSGGDGTPSKWDIVVPSLQQAITATDDSLSWGLKVLPEGEATGACTAASFPNDILVPIATKNAMTVNAAITATTDHGDGTPTGDAINKAVTYLGSLQDGHAKYLLLATDGDPSCPSGGDAAQAFALQAVTDAATAGYHTFVVGIASSASKISALNAIAVAGLEPRMDPDPTAPKFYLVASQAQLVTALEGITTLAATCIFQLSGAPPNPDHVGVEIGNTTVMKDPTNMNGWDFTGPDMKTIELYGAACDAVKSQAAGMVKVIFGCKDDPLF